VSFVLIGGLAMPHHGWARATLDVDLLIEATPENATAVREALAEVGFDVNDVSVAELQSLKILFRQYALRLDLHPSVAGVDFATVRARAVPSTLAGEPVLVPCLDDLIAMKAAAGRPKDLEDLRHLLEIRSRVQRQ
jgi:predicted nucleotidyltransferase